MAAWPPSSDPHALFIGRVMVVEPEEARLAVIDEEVVGFAHAQAKIVYVVPEQRRRGIGSRLMEACLAIIAGRRAG